MLTKQPRCRFVCGILLLTASLTGCNLEKDIEVALPEYTPQLVVEAYLESGQPYRLSLTESSKYLDKPEANVVQDATVIIMHQGRADTLRFNPVVDKRNKKAYTHTSRTIMQGQPGDTYGLLIITKSGQKIMGTTTVLPRIPIDSVQYNFNEKGKALVVARFNDPGETENYYRFSVHQDSLSQGARVDYSSPDRLNNGKPFAFGTGYDFKDKDTIIVSLYHLEKQYFDFVTTVEEARDANGNPFAQPTRVKSSVTGGLGIFTNLVYDRKTIVLKK